VRLLLVEDDPRMASLLARGLRAESYAVDVAASAEDARWLARENPYDLVVLDVMLPDGDGLELCRSLRAEGCWAPVLVLTARGAVADRVRGLDAGADDYLVKPFAFEELLARLRALARRGAHERPPVLRVGALELDPATRQVRVAGRPVSLSPREFALLELFMRRPGEVLSRREILDHVWDWAYEGISNIVDVYVRYLRAKLGRGPGIPTIETVRGAGYVLRSESSTAAGLEGEEDPHPTAADRPRGGSPERLLVP
jgi:two-component system OmpR family response regulator